MNNFSVVSSFCLVIGIMEKNPQRDLDDASLSFSYQEQSFVSTRPFKLRNNLVNRVVEILLKSFGRSYSAQSYLLYTKNGGETCHYFNCLKQILKTCSCPVNIMHLTTKLSDKSTWYLTSQHKYLTSRHHYHTNWHNCLKTRFFSSYVDLSDHYVNLSDI